MNQLQDTLDSMVIQYRENLPFCVLPERIDPRIFHDHILFSPVSPLLPHPHPFPNCCPLAVQVVRNKENADEFDDIDKTILDKLHLFHLSHSVIMLYLLPANRFIEFKGAEGSTRDPNENAQECSWELMDIVAASGERPAAIEYREEYFRTEDADEEGGVMAILCIQQARCFTCCFNVG